MKVSRLAQAVVATLCAGLAQAAPLVTQWTVVDTATFDPTTVQPGGGYPNPVLSAGNTQLRWGDAANQSGLVINNAGNPFTVDTGVLTPTITIRHDNFPIPAGNSLTSVDILGSLSLTSALPAIGDTIPAVLTFGVKFLETPNSGNFFGTCADGGTSGVGPLNGNGCADIFVIDQESLNFPFTYADNQYYFSFFANGFGTLSDAACTSVLGAGHNGCRGFETAEGVRTTAQFNVLITSTPFTVPEPASMALMGGALAALALAGRRRKQQ